MPPSLDKKEAKQTINLLNQLLREGFSLEGRPSAVSEAARQMGISRSTIYSRIASAERVFGFKVKMPTDARDPEDLVLFELKKGARSIRELAKTLKLDEKDILQHLDVLKIKGHNIRNAGDEYEISKHHEESYIHGSAFTLESNEDNTYCFGAIGDLHAGSKYCRWDVRSDLISRFEDAGVQCIFDTGNWIEGEASFNRYDLTTHGLDAQCRELAERHPRTEVPIAAVWGDDHEGWYASREGIDVGRYCESIMRSMGHNWYNLGFMEAHVRLVNTNTGAEAVLSVVHPGGGSSYALSYSIQKIVESYEGGEKPNVGLYGHYHKLWAGIIRNVWVVQTGCAQDQTPFMRKKRLEAHVGGVYVQLEQDPRTGAILGMTPKIIRYFNKGHYEGRWSKHGPVNPADRDPENI